MANFRAGRHTGAIAAFLGCLSAGPAWAGGSPLGVWFDDSGRGAVEISECGKGKLCGRLVWLKDPNNVKACGTPIIGDVGKVGGSWDGGWIYSPEKDAKYDVELTPSGDNKLTVLGYAGTKLFSQEMTWTRAPADLKRCDVQEAKAQPAPAAPGAQAAAAAPAKPAAEVSAPTPAPARAADQPTTSAVAPKPDAQTRETQMAAQEPAKSPEAGKAEAEKWASEPEKTRTAQADVPAAPMAKPRAKPRKKMCRVDAPFVRVEFPCDDD